MTTLQGVDEGRPVLEFTTVDLGLTLSGAEGGPDMFTPGNTITVSQLDAVRVTITYTPHWGGGTETLTIPAGAASGTVRIDRIDGSVVRFHVVSFSGFLASFASVALDGGPTGDNSFASPSTRSEGALDLATGAFHANIYVTFQNGLFSADDPAVVQVGFSGVYDANARQARIRYGSGDTLVVVSDSPGGDQPF